MKRKLLFIFLLVSAYIIIPRRVYAYSEDNYRYRDLCGNFEVASFKSDGNIEQKSCFGNYDEAKEYMKKEASDDLAIMTKVNGKTKIIDANVALLDLSVNPETLTYFYTNNNLTGSAYTYMDTGSLYGGVDGAHIETVLNSRGIWAAKVKIGNFTGWITQTAYEIVPITWVKSSSSYTVTGEYIRHNYVAKIQNEYYGSAGSTIGPKPEQLQAGKYYSYDGHYFYKDLTTLIKDYKNDNYNNAVNKNNKYYNYYQYLSNHTRTSYSSINIDEYIRNNLGITQDAYGNATNNGSSRLYGSGTFFYYAQEKYGVNALLALSLSRNETGNGRSNLAINKNNGFGLNAVDSNPLQAANWYPTYASSILGYASKWITNGFAHARDWRYFGPQFGDKWIGMNVKYASDTYWSEKMASNYYSFDKAKGLQDYNYYQLAVANGPVNAYQQPNTSSKFIYEYPEAEDAMVIVGETKGTTVDGSNIWYEVVSDINIDNNFNEINGDYNWNRTVFVPASKVTKINKGKNGYISPNDITEYQDSNYTYDLMVTNTEFTPKVGYSKKDTSFYYDSSLQSKKTQTLKKDRYVIIYSIAYKNNKAVSYLVTSDYKFSQKHWVPADTIETTSKAYGKVTVSVSGNQYTWVNSTTEDTKATLISGLYTNSYVPVLEEKEVDGYKWYKVPVDISGTTNQYGWTLASAPGVEVNLIGKVTQQNFPVINASDKTIVQGTQFKELDNVTANDTEDGNITSKVKVRSSNLDINKVGTYTITYEVTDSTSLTTTKTITVTVTKNESPVITAEDINIKVGETLKENYKATDKEDGDITSKVKTTKNNVNTKQAGVYEITYSVTDSYNQTTTKTIKVVVTKDEEPVINASDKTIEVGTIFKELDNVTATDKEDGNITKNIKVTENTVNTNKAGEYKVTYSVTDSNKQTTTKTIKVSIIEKQQVKEVKELTKKDGEFYLEELSFNKSTKKYTLSGYTIINGVNNDNSSTYYLVLKSINTNKEYEVEIDSWKNDTPFDIGIVDGYDYTNSWFKDTLDFTKVPNGDYDLYLKAVKGDYYTEVVVDNAFNNDIDRRGEDNTHGYTFRVHQNLKSQKMDVIIRDETYTTLTAPTYRNMINDYENITFTNNKLHLIGTSYNYGGTYSNGLLLTRKLIIEEVSAYKQYYYDLGYSTNAPYDVVCRDNKSKKYAWYDKEIDISNLPKGTYSLQVYTKTVDATDYGEITDDFEILEDTTKTINGKTYTVTRNDNRDNRIEIIVK